MKTPAEDECIVEITEVPDLQLKLLDFLTEGEPNERQKQLGWLLFNEMMFPSSE